MMFIHKIFISILIVATLISVWGLGFEKRWIYMTGLALGSISLGGILLGLVWLSI